MKDGSKKHILFFFIGLFAGLVVALGGVAIAGYSLYNKISINWVNKKFDTNIDLGDEELNSEPLKDLIVEIINVAENFDSYTFNDLQSDFGIGFDDNVAGIDFADVKSGAITELNKTLTDKFSKITADELAGLLGLKSESHNGPNDSGIDRAFNYRYTFYAFNNKLYYDEAHINQVKEFEYKFNTARQDVIIHNQLKSAATGSFEIALRYLPISVALSLYLDGIVV